MRDRIESWGEMLGALRDAMNLAANQQEKFTRKEAKHLLKAFQGVVEAEIQIALLLGAKDD